MADMTDMTDMTEAQALRAEVQALRQSVWHIERHLLDGKAESVVVPVRVSEIKIGFWQMVNLLATAAIASVPALIVVGLFFLILWSVVGALFLTAFS